MVKQQKRGESYSQSGLLLKILIIKNLSKMHMNEIRLLFVTHAPNKRRLEMNKDTKEMHVTATRRLHVQIQQVK